MKLYVLNARARDFDANSEGLHNLFSSLDAFIYTYISFTCEMRQFYARRLNGRKGKEGMRART